MNPYNKGIKSFIDKKVSVKQAIAILAKHKIKISENDAAVIIGFLYVVAKLYNKPAN